MAFTFKTSNPVESTFVENFFRQRSLPCRVVMANLYGFQNYQVIVDQDVDSQTLSELEKELRKKNFKVHKTD